MSQQYSTPVKGATTTTVLLNETEEETNEKSEITETHENICKLII